MDCLFGASQAGAAVGAWLLAQVAARRLAVGEAAAVTMVALDGKVLKGAWEELRDVKVKLFSALVHGEGVIIGQRKVETSNPRTETKTANTAGPEEKKRPLAPSQRMRTGRRIVQRTRMDNLPDQAGRTCELASRS